MRARRQGTAQVGMRLWPSGPPPLRRCKVCGGSGRREDEIARGIRGLLTPAEVASLAGKSCRACGGGGFA